MRNSTFIFLHFPLHTKPVHIHMREKQNHFEPFRVVLRASPANMRRWANDGLLFGLRRSRWAMSHVC